MKLIKFKVTNFRSIEDSGWIDAENVTALIGTNESGKTNVLLPLWKLNPAKDGQINPLVDYPRKRYNEIRSMKTKPTFIEALFEMPDDLCEKVAEMTGATPNDVKKVIISRNLGGGYTANFLDATPLRYVPKADVLSVLSTSLADISEITPAKSEEDLKGRMLRAISAADALANNQADVIELEILETIHETLEEVDAEKATKRSILAPRYGQLTDDVKEMLDDISRPSASESAEARNFARQNLPPFVYYSNYGNLDSEIYLPHVIQNLARTDLGAHEEAKARTLKVLFEFVGLEPQEILELGKDIDSASPKPSDEQIKLTAEKKKERTVLLQSASTALTGKFKNWWQQGNHIIEFQADGDHFRIWMSVPKMNDPGGSLNSV